MPTVDQNVKVWDESYEWRGQGDEWSRAWGGPSAQWYGTLLPRLRSFVPARTILEIAPGFGRWTQFLIPLCERLILVDISPKCIEVCRGRFAGRPGIEYHVNDGRSLAMAEDGSIDVAFSFDSLVHVELDVLRAYIDELAQKLSADGIAFLHHSNLGEYADEATGELPAEVPNPHWRAVSVTGERVRDACESRGLVCASQELLNWGGGDRLIDAITVIARPDSRWAGKTAVLRNMEFGREMTYVRRLAQLYDWSEMARGADPPAEPGQSAAR